MLARLVKIVCVCCVLVTASLTATSAYAYCSDGTTCPTGSSSFHQLVLTTFFGNTYTMQNGDKVILGTDNTAPFDLEACVYVASGNYWLLMGVKDLNATGGQSSTPSSLNNTSFFCSGSSGETGAEYITVASTGFVCPQVGGNVSMGAFAFGGYHLSPYGLGGNDNIDGGTGGVTDVCGGDGADFIYSSHSSNTVDGWAGNDTIEYDWNRTHVSVSGLSFLAYDGDDIIHVIGGTSGYSTSVYVDGEGGNDCIDFSGTYTLTDPTTMCSTNTSDPPGDRTNYSPLSGTDCDHTVTSC